MRKKKRKHRGGTTPNATFVPPEVAAEMPAWDPWASPKITDPTEVQTLKTARIYIRGWLRATKEHTVFPTPRGDVVIRKIRNASDEACWLLTGPDCDDTEFKFKKDAAQELALELVIAFMAEVDKKAIARIRIQAFMEFLGMDLDEVVESIIDAGNADNVAKVIAEQKLAAAQPQV